ncbi:AAA domain-containing protein [Paenarthrobacter ureafaciens]|uniref:AAA domain-containing protein n=2 Tax=Micrococcaceae TaxID=1268 RepID=UPI002118D12E|nr:AAA domain-containing protein [Paenarthrobacter ureafaciens]
MIDPRQEVVLIRNKERGGFDDKTAQVLAYHEAGNVINVTLGSRNGGRSYRYAATNVVVLGNPEVIVIHRADVVQIRGGTIQGVTEVLRFPGGRESWFRVFYSSESGDGYTTCPETQLRVTRKPEEVQAAEAVLDYWRDLAANLAPNDFLRREYSNFKDIPADSALRLLLEGRPPMSVDPAAPVLEPFSSNISQRDALVMALGNRISVIDGPPGTGKTQTIVNLIANLVSVQGKTVGVASLNNAAVENVRDKLIDHGLGHIVADLGRQDKRDEFFLRQGERNSDLDAWLRGPIPEEIPNEDLESSTRQLRTLQETSRQLALW